MPVTMPISPYLHVLDGRLRIKITDLKGAPNKALILVQQLLKLEGITDVNANPTTGNALILFDSMLLDHTDIIAAIQHCGYLTSTSPTLAFSKNLANDIGAIKYFICHYNLTKAAALPV